ncbi:Por secretion system C-terminal sorting domain-containing protein [Fibrobacter intestinalis]|uniref:Por secretion system C-terminal sorting domain-containing protein n=2 Tax=Fibrobacter TaxID=832 RepID=A0A1M6U5B0_9BACT|nr:glycoside hydrolase family 9 protein [Fibrobacter intestinalis]SHK64432.1 Por secretion system C-terminal sorting domain-containing protein [Fibrobacter intestinalis]
MGWRGLKWAHSLFAMGTVAFGNLWAQDVFITVDQFGYRPAAKKVAVLRSPESGYDAALSYVPGTVMEVVDSASNKIVFSGAPVAFQEGAVDTASGDKIWWFDFSSLSEPGTYFIRDKSDYTKQSFYFRIGEDIYNDILKAALRVLYYQRVGIAHEAAYAGEEWADGMNHDQDKTARLFTDSTNAATERDVSGGWFDAGDYNKYTVWNGNYVEMLLRAYLERPKAFTDDYGIPESGNGIPDILDEVNWGLTHLLRMQNADGSVLSVVGESHASPPSAAKGRTYYGAPNAVSAYSAAKAFALGSIVAKLRKNTEYAATLQDAALRAYAWAEAHPDSMFFNNLESAGTKGLAAGQQEVEENETTAPRLGLVVLADFALYELTGDAAYLNRFNESIDRFPLMTTYGSWAMDQYRHAQHQMYIQYLGYKDADKNVKAKIEEKFVNAFSTSMNFVQQLERDGYRAYLRDYNWGSNSAKSAGGLFFDQMAELKTTSGTDAATWHNAAEEYLHYLHGVNPFGMVYLSNMSRYGAEKSVSSFYHTWFNDGSPKWDSVSNSTPGPAPGYLTGGPNARYSWDACCAEYDADNSKKGCGSVSNNKLCYAFSQPAGEPPAKMYRNFNNGWPLNSWEVTEPSLGYQTNYIRLLSRFVEERGVGFDEDLGMARPMPAPPSALKISLSGKNLMVLCNADVREVRLFDVNHREVLLWSGSTQSVTLNLSALPSGVYFARVRAGKDAKLSKTMAFPLFQ